MRGVELFAKRGSQSALIAGLWTAAGDVTISSDADLQDHISAIEAVSDAHGQGNDVVYGVRSSRAKDSVFKRSSAEAYYRLLACSGSESYRTTRTIVC